MGGLFNINNGFFRAIGRIIDVCWLNILWVLTSLPIITIGASTTALYYTSMKMIRNEEGYVSSDFFRSFKDNFKQSTIIWLLLLLVTMILVCDYRFWGARAGIFYFLMKIVTIFISIIVLFTAVYIFPVQARFENRIRDNAKNAMLLSFRHLPSTVFMIFIAAIILVGAYFVPLMMLLYLLMGPAGTAYTQSALFNHIFNQYIPEEVLYPEDPGIQPEPEEDPAEQGMNEKEGGTDV